MADWKDILSDKEEHLSEEDLLKYLDEQLSKEDKEAIENISTDSFEADALQGLQQVANPEKAKNHIRQLKVDLQKQLLNKKNKKEKRKIKVFEWIIYAIILLLFICIVGYVLVKLSSNKTTIRNLDFMKQEQICKK